MTREKLRIELTEKERKEWWAGVALEFDVSAEGNVTVYEEWQSTDELHGDGCKVTMPARIWREAATWIEAQINALAVTI